MSLIEWSEVDVYKMNAGREMEKVWRAGDEGEWVRLSDHQAKVKELLANLMVKPEPCEATERLEKIIAEQKATIEGNKEYFENKIRYWREQYEECCEMN